MNRLINLNNHIQTNGAKKRQRKFAHAHGGTPMNENVIPLEKTERFGVYRGALSSAGELTQKERIGSAYMKRGTKKFRLKLWLFDETSYFVLPDSKDPKKYSIVIPSEYRFANGEIKTNWHRVGVGEVAGTYLRLNVYLLSEHIFLSMFPDKFHLAQSSNDAESA